MFQVQLQWKSFDLSLPAVEAWFKVNAGEYYIGNSADDKLTLWFSQDPGSEITSACEQYWDAITEESSEATSYVAQPEIDAAVATLKSGLLAKTWDQMSVAERKIVLGQMPTVAELGL